MGPRPAAAAVLYLFISTAVFNIAQGQPSESRAPVLIRLATRSSTAEVEGEVTDSVMPVLGKQHVRC
jgi:hypothetical protein